MTKTKPLHGEVVLVRTLLHGVLLREVAEINVDDSAGQSTCRIIIPYSPKLDLEQLKRMHLFISYATLRVMELFGEDPGDAPSMWPRIFEGEVVGATYSKTLQSRQIVIRGRSFDERFDQAKLIHYNPGREVTASEAAGAREFALFMGQTRIEIDADGALSKETQLWSTLKSRHETMEAENARDIAMTSAILDLLRTLGEYHPYFRHLDERYKLSSRFAAFSDTDVLNILELDAFRQVADGQVKGMDGSTSILQVLGIISGLIRYNWLQISQPVRRTGKELDELPVDVQRAVDNLSLAYEAAEIIDHDIARGVQVSLTPFGDIDLSRASTRKVSRREWINEVLRMLSVEGSDVNAAAQLVTNAFGVPSEVATSKPGGSGGSDAAAQAALGGAVNAKKASGKDKTQTTEALKTLVRAEQEFLQRRDELGEFALIPNMEFSHPPRCNVILPQQMDSWSINFDFGREITRLMARATLIGGGKKVDEWYVAPFSQSFYALKGTNVAKLDAQLLEYAGKGPQRDLRSIEDLTKDSSEDRMLSVYKKEE